MTFATASSAPGLTPGTSAPSAAPGHAPVGTISRFALDNGLDVVVVQDRRVPVVTHMVWYRVGSADEPHGRSGIAHFLEHLMFKGTDKHPAGEFSNVVSEIGGQENAFTSYDYTAYFQRVAPQHLETVMGFEADRMTGLVLSDEVVLPERDVVLEEQNTRVANDPGAQLSEELSAALFRNHPYGRPIIGWRHEIEHLSREDALSVYRRFYAPNNAILVVAGDVEPEGVKALAEATYGRVARQPDLPPRSRPQEPGPRAARVVSLSDARVEQPNIQRLYLVPSYVTAAPLEAEALDMLAQILGGGATSRLYRGLVMDTAKAANAGAWYQGGAIDGTRFAIYAVPRPGVSLVDLEAAIDAEVARIAADGVTEAELSRARTRLVADTIYAQDSQATLARMYGAALAVGSTLADVQEWPDRIRQVTAGQVKAAAAVYLDRRRAVTGYLLKDGIAPSDPTPGAA
jgi:zinc protease